MKKNDQYKTNFLQNVIFRIDFFKDKLSIDDFDIKKIKSRFSIFEPKTVKEKAFLLKNDKGKEPSISEASAIETKQYIFKKEDSSATLVITNQNLVFNYTEYKNFAELKNDVATILNAFFQNSSEIISRIGLRYINYFEPKAIGSISWESFINQKYIISNDFEAKELQSMSVWVGKKETDLIKVQYGKHNPNLPNESLKDNFVIDIDVYTTQIADDLKLENILSDWNQLAKDVFEKIITEEMRKILNGESELK